jgi:two-component system, LytTR family, sensor kinase
METNRFKFWRIFWVVLAIYIFLSLLGIIFIMLAPSATSGINWNKFTSWTYLRDQVMSFCFSLAFYYYTLNVFYRLYSNKKSLFYFIRPILLTLFVTAVYQALCLIFLKGGEAQSIRINNKPVPEFSMGLMIFVMAFSAVLFICISLLISYLIYLRDEKKQRKILEEQKMQLEVEKSQANLNFLKAQINPHFLHNTLNFLYAKALPLSPDLSEGILTLSDMMRYALSEGNSKDGKAPLKDEIEHVRNVIKIQQLRFNNSLKVNFEVEGVINGAMIIPFVLITLVENAFKHGDLKNPDAPIDIKLKVEHQKLYFYCRNRKKTGPKELSTGIGLDNIEKRLDLAYGKNYRFKVKDEAEFYTTELIIDQL